MVQKKQLTRRQQQKIHKQGLQHLMKIHPKEYTGCELRQDSNGCWHIVNKARAKEELKLFEQAQKKRYHELKHLLNTDECYQGHELFLGVDGVWYLVFDTSHIF